MFLYKSKTLPVVFSVFFFALSFFVFPYYIRGDQIYYRSFYELLPEYSFSDGFSFYKSALSSREPGYYVLTYLFSGLLGKDILMSFVNAALGYLFTRLLLARNVSGWVVVLLSFNFYLLVLFFSAERLKLGILFSLLALGTNGFVGRFFWIAALLSHIQVLLLLASQLISKNLEEFRSIFRGKLKIRLLFSIGAIIFVAGFIFFVLGEHVHEKFERYSGQSETTATHYLGGFTSLLKPLVFVFLSVCYAKSKKLEVLAVHTPLLFAAFFIGDERIVIFSYFLFMFYALQVNRGLNFGVIVTAIYFLFKGVLFLGDIIAYGNGFHGA